MNKIKCKACGLVNWNTEPICKRCSSPLLHLNEEDNDDNDSGKTPRYKFLKRSLAIIGAIVFILFVWFLSLIDSSERLKYDDKQVVYRTVDLIEQKGFSKEAFILKYLVTYRATDNWWNRWVGHADAFAATNFPFEIVTLYPEFFNKTTDDTERAAILLHEAYHLLGKGEPEAFAGVWKDKQKLGWTSGNYGHTKVWNDVKELTQTYAPHLFQCGSDGKSDCFENNAPFSFNNH
jgi:hypothetical protein